MASEILYQGAGGLAATATTTVVLAFRGALALAGEQRPTDDGILDMVGWLKTLSTRTIFDMATMLSADEETMVQAGSEVGLAVDELVAYVFGGVWLEGQPRPDARDLDEAIQDGLALSSGALEKRLLIRTRAAARRLDDSEIYIIGCNPLHVVLQAMKLGGNAVGLEQGAGIAPGVEAIHQALCGCGLRDTAGLRPQLTPRDHVEAICASRYPALDEGQPGWESAVRALATDGLLRDVIRLMDV